MSTRHNMTNGWLGIIMALAFAGMVTSARGGSLDAPAGPASPASAMWTLNDIYNVLDTRTTNVTKRTGGFTEPTAGPTSGTMHNLNDIMALVTNRVPVGKTGQTDTYAVGDDGTSRIGVAWPNPRFTVQSTNTPGSPDDRTNCVLDNLTGLMWARNASNACGIGSAKTNWGDAVTNCNNLTYGGYSDWRLPNRNELSSLIALRHSKPTLCNTAGIGKWVENDPFTGVQSDTYWSSTALAEAGARYTWVVSLSYGEVDYADKPYTSPYYVWPVRGGR